MHKRHISGFTVVELLIVIVVISILAAIGIVAYDNIRRSAADHAAQSDLTLATGEMQRSLQQNGLIYPTTLPASIVSSPDTTLTLKYSGNTNHYDNLTEVQNGVLLAKICQDLITEGVGKGVNASGVTNAYIINCGNWNHDSMQINGWNPQKYTTPVTDIALLNYADNFTTNDNTNKIHETVVRTFYHQLVERQVTQGGRFPVTSFWDSWATPTNGGVMTEPLGVSAKRPHYCIEATNSQYSDLKWHVTEDLKLEQSSCQ